MVESLPALLETFSQRGLLGSWTAAHSDAQEQSADPRQGQPRRQRAGGHPGGRRQARSNESSFRVEVR
jgi:hypothetical protein